MPELPDGFWVWLCEQDPERVPFRPYITDPELAELMEIGERRVGGGD